MMQEGDSSTKFSPSKLGMYQDCPRRYYYRYVEKIKRTVRSIEAFCGECAHAAFEALYEAAAHAKVLSLPETLKVYEDYWAAHWSSDIRIRDGYSQDDWKKVGRQCVETYYSQHEPFDADKTVAVEKQIGFDVETSSGKIRLEGYIDRLALAKDGAFEIHDYKTGKSLPTQAEVDADWQLAIYDAAVRSNWPDTKAVRLIWHYVRHGKALVSMRTPEQLAALKAEIAALIDRIRADREFEARKSALCDWCEYRDLCPHFAHAESLAKLPEAERGQDAGARLVARLSRLDARKRELKDELKTLELDWDAAAGDLVSWARKAKVDTVYGEGGHASVSEKEELKLPTKTHAAAQWEALEREVRAEPELWMEVSHVDVHRLLQAFRERKLGARLLALVDSVVTRFGRRSREATVRFHRDRGGPED